MTTHLCRPSLKLLAVLAMGANPAYANRQLRHPKTTRRAFEAGATINTCFPSNVTSIRIASTTKEQISMFEFKAYDDSGAEVPLVGISATQSSTYKNNAKFGALSAVDGDSTTFSHTNDANAFWQLDLAQEHQISGISIANRWCKSILDPTGCLCRLSNTTISLLDSQGTVIDSDFLGDTCGDLNPGVNFDFCTKGRGREDCLVRKLKLEATTGEPIQIFEVEVTNSGGWTALQQATQSSTFGKFAASNAVDGINNTFSHTATDDKSAWLEVDFSVPFDIFQVSIQNRWCKDSTDPNGCLCRLSGAKLTYYNKNGAPKAIHNISNTCGQVSINRGFSTSCSFVCQVNSDCPSGLVCKKRSNDMFSYCVCSTCQAMQEWAENSNLQDVDVAKDIPSKCNLDKYDIGLYAFANQSSHFFLGAMALGKEADVECPPALAFASQGGHKRVLLVHQEEDFKGYDFNVHPLGMAELKDILNAERVAKAIDDTKYDLTENTCIHYAASIWRDLNFEETEDLGNFIIENLLRDDGALEYARQNAKYDGSRALTSYIIGGEGGFEDYVKEIVFSQLNLNE